MSARKEVARSCVLYNEMVDDFYSLPDFDEDEPDVEAHAAEPLGNAAETDEPDDDVEGHGQSSFR